MGENRQRLRREKCLRRVQDNDRLLVRCLQAWLAFITLIISKVNKLSVPQFKRSEAAHRYRVGRVKSAT